MKHRTSNTLGSPTDWDREPRKTRAGGLCECELREQNAVHAGTGGVSRNNRGAGFLPAYKDVNNGIAVISRFADGRPAPVHVLEGLPNEWVGGRDDDGRVCCARDGIVAGFLRGGEFYTREAAARVVAQGTRSEN